MNLKQQIFEDMKAAMRAHAVDRLSAIRMLLAAIKQKEVDERVEVTDVDVLAIVDRLIRQRRDSISQFEAGGRQDLVAREQAEVEVLSAYLPQQLDAVEVSAAVDAAMAEVGAAGIQSMGKVMAILKPRLSGRADMAQVSAMVKSKLTR